METEVETEMIALPDLPVIPTVPADAPNPNLESQDSETSVGQDPQEAEPCELTTNSRYPSRIRSAPGHWDPSFQ